jgi:regulator of extracellular matrix RemA (YlzA/DUF370 family)
MRLVNLGFGNVVVAERVVAVLQPQGSPMKRLKEEARAAAKLVDATRSVVLCDTGHVMLSAVQVETIAARLTAPEGSPEADSEPEPLVTPAVSFERPPAAASPRRGG